MSFAETLDRLVGISDYAFNYSGHLDWCTIQIPQDLTTIESPSCSNDATIEDCAEWIREPLPTGRPATLRLLLITTIHPTSRNSLSRRVGEPHTAERERQANAVRKAFEDTELPIAGFAAYVRTLLSFAQVPSVNTAPNKRVSRYYYSSPPWGLTWSYCATTGHTKAILLCRKMVKARLWHYLDNVLKPLGRFADHPMLLAYMTIEFSLAELCILLLQTSNEILGLEKHTGLSAWDWVHEHEIPGSHVPSNYEYTSTRLSIQSGKVTHIRFRLRTIKEYSKSVRRIAEQHKSTVRDPAAQSRCEEVEEILGIMSEYIEVRLHKADSLQERLDSQVSGMSTIISQRDTSAMKTVAMVTMVFLPGTFVASFFAMPMLNWDATALHEIVTPRFWIYWIVTVPLTIVVFAVWWVRQKVKEGKETKAEKEREILLNEGRTEVIKEVARRCAIPKSELAV
jgi:hypothetical protein